MLYCISKCTAIRIDWHILYSGVCLLFNQLQNEEKTKKQHCMQYNSFICYIAITVTVRANYILKTFLVRDFKCIFAKCKRQMGFILNVNHMFSAWWCDGVRQIERERELKFCRCLALSCFSEGFHNSEHKSFIALTQCSVSHGLFIKWGVSVYHTANPAQHRYRLTAVCTLMARESQPERRVSFVWLILAFPESSAIYLEIKISRREAVF